MSYVAERHHRLCGGQWWGARYRVPHHWQHNQQTSCPRFHSVIAKTCKQQENHGISIPPPQLDLFLLGSSAADELRWCALQYMCIDQWFHLLAYLLPSACPYQLISLLDMSVANLHPALNTCPMWMYFFRFLSYLLSSLLSQCNSPCGIPEYPEVHVHLEARLLYCLNYFHYVVALPPFCTSIVSVIIHFPLFNSY